MLQAHPAFGHSLQAQHSKLGTHTVRGTLLVSVTYTHVSKVEHPHCE